jgi:hypothetical protein
MSAGVYGGGTLAFYFANFGFIFQTMSLLLFSIRVSTVSVPVWPVKNFQRFVNRMFFYFITALFLV